jgi:hypothetical protein
MMNNARGIARTALVALAAGISISTIAIGADQVTGTGRVDANGILYHDFAGFEYAAERTDWRRNFRADGSMRHDFLNVPHDNQCLVGYFKVSGPDNEEISAKLASGPHTDREPTWADTYGIGVINVAGTRARLRYEATHPRYRAGPSRPVSGIGRIEGRWVGALGCKLNIDRNGDGTPDTARIVAMVDAAGLDASGRPGNDWRTTLDVEIPFAEVGLKSPATPYVATIGHPEDAQATFRTDEQGPAYEYRYVTYRRLERRAAPASIPPPRAPAQSARGPLRVHPENPRYFTDGTRAPDGSLRAVYLTGAHTWNSLVDMGRSDPPEPFDFDRYLAFLERHHHNFIRLWAWDSTVWDTRANGRLGKPEFVHHAAPLPWARTGPGLALDGKPKFDLTQFDQAYFDRLRARVSAAGQRGIYVSIMLFEGWGLLHGNRGRAAPDGWAWRAHPFNPANNINDAPVEGASEIAGRVHRLGNQVVNDLQANYVRRVVDTVNEFDHVLYEVINEGGEVDWNRWIVQVIRDDERTKPKQHPIGITGHGLERLPTMVSSPADWISPGRVDGYAEDPPAWSAEHGKVSLLDTDHIWGVGGTADWVWRAFLRGHNPIFMDPYDGYVLGTPGDPQWEPVRTAMGRTRRWADRLGLAAMTPVPEVASTGYCLVGAGREYLVYAPEGGAVTVDLSAAEGELDAEWYDLTSDQMLAGARVSGGARRTLEAPGAGPRVLYIRARR